MAIGAEVSAIWIGFDISEHTSKSLDQGRELAISRRSRVFVIRGPALVFVWLKRWSINTWMIRTDRSMTFADGRLTWPKKTAVFGVVRDSLLRCLPIFNWQLNMWRVHALDGTAEVSPDANAAALSVNLVVELAQGVSSVSGSGIVPRSLSAPLHHQLPLVPRVAQQYRPKFKSPRRRRFPRPKR